jgi:hypothetical protein
MLQLKPFHVGSVFLPEETYIILILYKYLQSLSVLNCYSYIGPFIIAPLQL